MTIADRLITLQTSVDEVKVAIAQIGTPTVTVDFTPVIADIDEVKAAIAAAPQVNLQPVLDGINEIKTELQPSPVVA